MILQVKKLLTTRGIILLAGIGAGVIIILFIVTNLFQENEILDSRSRKLAPGKFVTLSNGVTHYYEIGSGNSKPVVLIHGGGVTGLEVWSENAEFLAENGYRVLQYDLYGRGYSDRLITTYTPELLSRQLTELLEAVDFPDSFNVISMSLGSLVALDYTSKAQINVPSLILIDPAITGDFKPSKALNIPILSQVLMTLYWYPRSVENQRKEFVDQELFESYSQRLKYFMKFEGYKHVNYSTWINTLNQSRLEDLKKRIPYSTLLIYGENDPYFSNKTAQQLTKVDTTIQIHSIKNAGHLPHYEKPDEVNTIILNFLNRQDY